jgi:hypothetical protein
MIPLSGRFSWTSLMRYRPPSRDGAAQVVGIDQLLLKRTRSPKGLHR